MSDRIPFRVNPSATLVSELSIAWLGVEAKDDGESNPCTYKEGSHVSLVSRNNKARTETFTAIASEVAALGI